MAAEKLIGDKYPGPGMSYIMPDRSWLNISLDASGEQIRAVQARFWLAWANRREFLRSASTKESPKKGSASHPKK